MLIKSTSHTQNVWIASNSFSWPSTGSCHWLFPRLAPGKGEQRKPQTSPRRRCACSSSKPPRSYARQQTEKHPQKRVQWPKALQEAPDRGVRAAAPRATPQLRLPKSKPSKISRRSQGKSYLTWELHAKAGPPSPSNGSTHTQLL